MTDHIRSDSAVAVGTTGGALPLTLLRAYRSVVLVQTRKMWATGILVSKDGHVVTCAHVFDAPATPVSRANKASTGTVDVADSVSAQPSVSKVVRDVPPVVAVAVDVYAGGAAAIPVRRLTRTWRSARVVYCSSGDLDIAMLQILPRGGPDGDWEHVSVSPHNVSAQPGDGLVALGYALFGAKTMAQPTLCHGVVSKVVRLRGRDAIIETSARVYHGHSGGMIVSSSGEFLGMVTSNSVAADGVIIPEINFAIPALWLHSAVAACRDAKLPLPEAKAHALDVHDPALLALWDLRDDAQVGEAPVAAVAGAGAAAAGDDRAACEDTGARRLSRLKLSARQTRVAIVTGAQSAGLGVVADQVSRL